MIRAQTEPSTSPKWPTRRSSSGLRAMAACAFVVAALAGCSAYSPKGIQTGATEAEVVQAMGTPTGRYKLPNGGTRLEFARGPAGHETYMVDFDASGRMVDWEQVMDLWYLTRIEPGMSVDEVLIRVGHPAVKMPIPRQQLVVWNYRYPTTNCLWFQISIGDDGKVISGNQATDPQCDPGGNVRGGGGIGGGIGGVR